MGQVQEWGPRAGFSLEPWNQIWGCRGRSSGSQKQLRVEDGREQRFPSSPRRRPPLVFVCEALGVSRYRLDPETRGLGVLRRWGAHICLLVPRTFGEGELEAQAKTPGTRGPLGVRGGAGTSQPAHGGSRIVLQNCQWDWGAALKGTESRTPNPTPPRPLHSCPDPAGQLEPLRAPRTALRSGVANRSALRSGLGRKEARLPLPN